MPTSFALHTVSGKGYESENTYFLEQPGSGTYDQSCSDNTLLSSVAFSNFQLLLMRPRCLARADLHFPCKKQMIPWRLGS